MHGGVERCKIGRFTRHDEAVYGHGDDDLGVVVGIEKQEPIGNVRARVVIDGG